MRRKQSYVVLGLTLVFSLASVYFGSLRSDPWVMAGGAAGLCYVLARLARRDRESPAAASGEQPATVRPVAAVSGKPVDPGDTGGLVEQMLAQGRYALLLRPQVADNLDKNHFCRTLEALAEGMALVPDGEVVLGRIDQPRDDWGLDHEEVPSTQGRVIQVKRFFLDRYPVTNRQFYEFVAGGGYEQMALWDATMLPALLDLVDRTGMPGPRYWRDGCYLPDEESHPVVGVSWYEAGAYARWLGKRLPSDAEWVKAGSWPVSLSPTERMQRKYPWGEAMDLTRANLWGAGPECVVPVDEFPEGISVGGVHQLIGNVWEWTAGSFRAGDHPLGELTLPTPMKSVRGGAFDTYFENQATCHFQSGENPLGRKYNIGFRCAVGVCDLMLAHTAADDAEPAAEPDAEETEEVLA